MAHSLSPDRASLAADLVRRTRSGGGLAPVDLERFWSDQDRAVKDPFGSGIPQVPLGIMMSWECVFGELGIGEDAWRYLNDEQWALGLARAYNDRAEQVVGRRLIDENPKAPADAQFPQTRLLHDVFGARYVWHNGSWWLEQSMRTEDELRATLDRIDAMDLRSFVLPNGWDDAKARLMPRGIRPPLYRSQRGPVTFAMSIYGVENLIDLIIFNPDLAGRFRDAILNVMLEIARVLDEEAGYSAADAPRGFSFFDDNCCLLSPDMYEFFGFPILEGVFRRYAPGPSDWRYQHSDSAMSHLLPLLARLNFSQVNFGPTLTVAEIREHMPRSVIQGQLAPFTFSRNEEENVVAEFLRDFDMARPGRGLLFATAGSINNGSRLSGMRLIMSAIQQYGRY